MRFGTSIGQELVVSMDPVWGSCWFGRAELFNGYVPWWQLRWRCSGSGVKIRREPFKLEGESSNEDVHGTVDRLHLFRIKYGIYDGIYR